MDKPPVVLVDAEIVDELLLRHGPGELIAYLVWDSYDVWWETADGETYWVTRVVPKGTR